MKSPVYDVIGGKLLDEGFLGHVLYVIIAGIVNSRKNSMDRLENIEKKYRNLPNKRRAPCKRHMYVQ